MGLDMYLNARRFIWYNEEDLAQTVSQVFPELKGLPVKEVVVEAMYWRKANAIHKWFVDNIQDGEDDCNHYSVSKEDLAELRDLILEVLKTRDASKLPPQSGFFFGNTEVNEWYWQDLEHTAERLTKILDEFPDSKWDFEYHSSW